MSMESSTTKAVFGIAGLVEVLEDIVFDPE
jgi:hypothetical protein